MRRADGDKVVITKSGINALSHTVLHPNKQAHYASTSGSLNPSQPALIRSAIEKLGTGATLVITTDNDASRRALAKQIQAITRQTTRTDLTIIRDLPEGEGSDWNDQLRAREPLPTPAPDR